MSTVLFILIIWVAASVVFVAAWALLGLWIRRLRREEEQALREWRRRMRALNRPRLPRQRRRGDGRERKSG